MKVVLVYPNIARLGFFCAGGPEPYMQDKRQKPLGLLYLASALIKQGHEVEMLDLRFLTGFKDYEKRLMQLSPDLVGISFMTPSRDYAFRCAEIAKEQGRWVVGGGVYATRGHADMIDGGYFDYVITGEGDISFPVLVADLEKGDATGGKVIRGEMPRSLDELPFPDIRLYDLDFYTAIPGWGGFRTPATGLICTRGCPARCTFCKPLAEEMFGKKIRFRSIDNVMEEIGWYVEELGVKTIHTYDDTFTFKRSYVLEFCERMAGAGLDVDWTVNTRSNCIDDEVAAALKRGGCKMVSFGFESGSQRILDFIKKGITVEQSLRAAEACHRHGIRFLGNILVGVPGETDEDFELTYDFLRRARPEIVYVNNLIPFPGTEIREYCEEKGILKPVMNYEDYMSCLDSEPLAGVDYGRVRRFASLVERGKLLSAVDRYADPLRRRADRLVSKARDRLRYVW
ncbi:MAG: radical SAM protein [Candidatus Tritonobacter lacicola]|nr:radical SAM protein [Candidatus Tritonobacter lacicola]